MADVFLPLSLLIRAEICPEQRLQPAGIHRPPECPLILTAVKKPDTEIPGEVNRIGLRPVIQFPEFSGASSAAGFGSSDSGRSGLIALVNILKMPSRASCAGL